MSADGKTVARALVAVGAPAAGSRNARVFTLTGRIRWGVHIFRPIVLVMAQFFVNRKFLCHIQRTVRDGIKKYLGVSLRPKVPTNCA